MFCKRRGTSGNFGISCKTFLVLEQQVITATAIWGTGSHITQTGRGRPLTSRIAVVELIGATTTKSGLKVESALDTRTYQKGIKVSKAEMARLDITGDPFHSEWNYTIRPRQPSQS